MKYVSLTGIGVLVMLIEWILKFFGLEVSVDGITEAVNGFISFIAFVMIIVGQVRRRDLEFGLVRKNPRS